MHQINVEKKNLVPEGEVYIVQIGCQTFMTIDRAFVSKWIGNYIADPERTVKDWQRQSWNDDEKKAGAEIDRAAQPTLRRR